MYREQQDVLRALALALTVALAWGCGGDGGGGDEEPQDLTGSIVVTTNTSGTFPDNGYQMTVNGAGPEPLFANGTEAVGGLLAGTYELVLSDIAGNCAADGGATRSVTLGEADTAQVTFDVSCTSGPWITALNGPSVVTFNRSGQLLDSTRIEIAWADPDGNADLVTVELLSDRNMALGGTGAKFSETTGVVAGTTSGTFVMLPGCFNLFCNFGPGAVRIGVTVTDADGNSSPMQELAIEVTEPVS